LALCHQPFFDATTKQDQAATAVVVGNRALVRCLERKNFLLSTKESPYKY
jgi:hypothetical protein